MNLATAADPATPFYTPESFNNRVTFVTGLSKGCGKTTCFSFLIEQVRRFDKNVALCSVGNEGEGRDSLNLEGKPLIRLREGDVVVTAEDCLSWSNVEPEILERVGERTAFGALVVARVQRPGAVVLVGPSSNAALSKSIEKLQQISGISSILIDGAFNRITQIASARRPQFFHVARFDATDFAQTELELERLDWLLQCPQAKGDGYTLRGPLTETMVQALPNGDKPLIVSDLTKVSVDLATLKSLKRPLQFAQTLPCSGFVLWGRDFDPLKVRQRLSSIKTPIFFNPYDDSLPKEP